jgi:hypothetical protein
LLWTYDKAEPSGKDTNLGVLQIVPSSGIVSGGPYNVVLNNPSSYFDFCNASNDGDLPLPFSNMAIDSLGNSWFAGGSYNDGCMFVIPNMTAQGASAAISQGTWGWVLWPTSGNLNVAGPTFIDGGDNAWTTTFNNAPSGYLLGYNSENASSTYEATAADTALLTPQLGYNATDPSANASGRTGGTPALAGNGYGTGLGVDGSGNLWVSGLAQGGNSVFGSQLTEFIGIAAPVQTPLATALTNKALGAKP